MAVHPTILEQITLDDLAGDLRLIAEQTTIEIALEVHSKCSGLKLYIPQSALDPFKRRFIAENRRRYSPKQLASMLAVSETYVYDVINSGRMQNQVDLFSNEEKL